MCFGLTQTCAAILQGGEADRRLCIHQKKRSK